ncbi:MarR family winged helix-turn-helix transcriptional regulator [Jiangella anatolica]|uniref:MarR family transcriptional regulator n=1 Tax=Jiangella anatolica TaxID=2670374 RepID=A0A2W2AVV2_9ACTN|nr:MarR family winged helix-turn-helix transcriptional regulator [Jiangella anatolica]PZF79345.1 MarR family transcriptional regulator [Jiangella anatolica]
MAVTRTAGQDLAGLVLPLAKALVALESAVARRHGLTSWQCAILRAAAEPPGRTQRELVGAIGYDRNRIVGDLDDLERRALLFRRVDDLDRRSNRIEVTAAGRRLARAAARDLRAGTDDLLAAVGPDETREATLHALTALRDRCADDAWSRTWLRP